MRLNDPQVVERQYATEAGLATRRDAQLRYRRGANAFDVALAVVLEARPSRLLEVGCGMGNFAERVAAETDADVLATDLSQRMVDLSTERGLQASVADVQSLPFEDAVFDCAVANWMLYHVPEVGRALAELRRVVRPGGTVVATTIGAEHMAELWTLVGFPVPARAFSRENGEALLREHFDSVERHDVEAELVFPDEESVHAYVDSTTFADAVPRPLPRISAPFRSRDATTVFVAR